LLQEERSDVLQPTTLPVEQTSYPHRGSCNGQQLCSIVRYYWHNTLHSLHGSGMGKYSVLYKLWSFYKVTVALLKLSQVLWGIMPAITSLKFWVLCSFFH